MLTALIVAGAIIVYFGTGAVTMVRFVADDMRFYWAQGDTYEDSDLSSAIVAGAVRAIVWPLTVTLSLIRKAIRASAYRIAARSYDPPPAQPDDYYDDAALAYADDDMALASGAPTYKPRH